MKTDKVRDIVGSVVGIVGVIVWFVETWSFGWNSTPKTKEEVILNMVGWCLIVIGFFIRPTRVDNSPTNINTNNVEFINKQA
jgi:hypothetical protein